MDNGFLNGMPHGGNVWDGGNPGRFLDFSASLRPEGPPGWVLETLKDAVLTARYYPERSMAAARKGIAGFLGLNESRVLPTAGGVAAIEMALSLRAGTVYTQSVTFGEYAARAAARGRKVSHFNAGTNPENISGEAGRAGGREIQGWVGGLKPGDTVVICNPNNPTGQATARRDMLTLSGQIAARGGELIVDEAFIGFCPENSVCGDIDDDSQLTVIGSLTKILCIPGVRLGYIASGQKAIKRLESSLAPWPLNSFALAVAERLPEHKAELAQDAALNSRRRDELTAKLRGLGASVLPSEANFLLADFKRDMSDVAMSLRDEGILVRTCGSFGLPASFLRLAVRTESENARLIAALRRAMRM